MLRCCAAYSVRCRSRSLAFVRSLSVSVFLSLEIDFSEIVDCFRSFAGWITESSLQFVQSFEFFPRSDLFAYVCIVLLATRSDTFAHAPTHTPIHGDVCVCVHSTSHTRACQHNTNSFGPRTNSENLC